MSTAWRQDTLNADELETIFYTGYTTIRTAIITPILMLFLFVVLRVAGHRTLVQGTLMNRITSVAIGSLVGGVALRPNSPLTAFVIGSLIIVWCSLLMDLAYTFKLIPATLMHSKPVLLYIDGQMVHKGLHRCLLIPEQVHSAVRGKGHVSMSKVYAVVLEPNGLWSVITHDAVEAGVDLLQGVDGYPSHDAAPSRGQHSQHSKENGRTDNPAGDQA